MNESFSHRRKLARADRHIANIQAMLTRWSRDGHRTFQEPNREGGLMCFAQQLKPLPEQLVLAIGDALHCQRASLDQIVFALSKAHTPSLTQKQEGHIAFPIDDKAIAPNNFRIKFVCDQAKRDICDLAPDPDRQQLHMHPLWVLNKVENRDKHRQIPVAVTGIAPTLMVIAGGSDFFRNYGPKALETGANPVLVCEFTRPPHPNDHVGLTVQVAFDGSTEMGNMSVERALLGLSNHIRQEVFERLEAHLGQPLP